MSRSGTADVVVVKPTNNIYTVLIFAATFIAIGAFIAMFLRAKELFGAEGLFS